MPGDPNGEHDAQECGGTCPAHRPASRYGRMRAEVDEMRERLQAPLEGGAGEPLSLADLLHAEGQPYPTEAQEFHAWGERGPVSIHAQHVAYLSTHCLHGNCEVCSASEVPASIRTAWGVMEGMRSKKPAQCKSCGRKCLHICHCTKTIIDPALVRPDEVAAYCGFHGQPGDGWPCRVAWSIEKEAQS